MDMHTALMHLLLATMVVYDTNVGDRGAALAAMQDATTAFAARFGEDNAVLVKQAQSVVKTYNDLNHAEWIQRPPQKRPKSTNKVNSKDLLTKLDALLSNMLQHRPLAITDRALLRALKFFRQVVDPDCVLDLCPMEGERWQLKWEPVFQMVLNWFVSRVAERLDDGTTICAGCVGGTLTGLFNDFELVFDPTVQKVLGAFRFPPCTVHTPAHEKLLADAVHLLIVFRVVMKGAALGGRKVADAPFALDEKALNALMLMIKTPKTAPLTALLQRITEWIAAGGGGGAAAPAAPPPLQPQYAAAGGGAAPAAPPPLQPQYAAAGGLDDVRSLLNALVRQTDQINALAAAPVVVTNAAAAQQISNLALQVAAAIARIRELETVMQGGYHAIGTLRAEAQQRVAQIVELQQEVQRRDGILARLQAELDAARDAAAAASGGVLHAQSEANDARGVAAAARDAAKRAQAECDAAVAAAQQAADNAARLQAQLDAAGRDVARLQAELVAAHVDVTDATSARDDALAKLAAARQDVARLQTELAAAVASATKAATELAAVQQQRDGTNAGITAAHKAIVAMMLVVGTANAKHEAIEGDSLFAHFQQLAQVAEMLLKLRPEPPPTRPEEAKCKQKRDERGLDEEWGAVPPPSAKCARDDGA